MQEMAERALNVAQLKGVQYADVRVVLRRTEEVLVKNGRVEAISLGSSEGFGVRALVDGYWGFAASASLSTAHAEEVADLAVRIARASARVAGEQATLSPATPVQATYRTPLLQDPFQVPLDQKITLLLAADAAARQVNGVSIVEVSYGALQEEKLFASTEGHLVRQTITETGAGLEVSAVSGEDVQRRSYPNSFGRQQGTGGYELVLAMDLAAHAPRVAEEAVALLTAPPCPEGEFDLVIDGTQMALQVHESCGHPVELDRALGFEASFAGTSFLTPDLLGRFRYGSEHVTITADATVPGGLGTFGYDDEGVPAQRVPIIQQGMFVDYLSSRETAARLGRTSTGAMRADGWNRIPLIRMTNINLEPGPYTTEELIAGVQHGFYLSHNKSWSIDDKRLNFQFGTEVAWEITDGKLGRLYRNPVYTGITPEFWRRCDGVAKEWRVWGIPNCGKGEPIQTAHVGHGTAAARFRGVRLISLR